MCSICHFRLEADGAVVSAKQEPMRRRVVDHVNTECALSQAKKKNDRLPAQMYPPLLEPKLRGQNGCAALRP